MRERLGWLRDSGERVRRNLLKLVLSLAIGAFFVWLSAKDWQLDQLAGEVRFEAGHLTIGAVPVPTADLTPEAIATQRGWSLELIWLLPYLGVLILVHFLRVIRWKPLLDPIAPMNLRDHNRIGAVGFMAMFLFPFRLGELVRPYLVKRAVPNVRGSAVLATVVVERVLDGLVVSLILFVVLQALPTAAAHRELQIGAWAALLVFAGAAVLLAGARWQHERTRWLVTKTAGLLSKRLAAAIDRILEAFLEGLRRLPTPRDFGLFVALTLVYWGVNGLGVWFVVRAFHLPVDLVGAYAMMACVVVGMMIPNSPGNVGTFWYFLLLPISLYGVSPASGQATALGLVVWLMQLVQQSAFGLWFVARGGVKWRGVVQATYESEESLASPETASP